MTITENVLDVYFEALKRLEDGCPQVVPKGTRISNDAVSLEAGRQKGSIKRSRAQFAKLIADIDVAAANQRSPGRAHVLELTRLKQNIGNLRQQLDAALGRENSLVLELYEARKEIAKLNGERILPIRKKKRTASGSGSETDQSYDIRDEDDRF